MKSSRAFLLIFLVLCGCGRDDRWNVLLVTFDTTRADHLSCYGYGEPTSPNVDAIAEDGVLFTQAFTTNPITLPGHASILTGTYPVFHGVRDNSTYVVRETVTSLAEVLADEGYDNSAVVAAFVLDSRFNLDQGFASYNDDIDEGWSKDELEMRAVNAFGFAERKANLVTAAAIDWLEQPRRKPFFLWLHYFDPHQPINAPEPHSSRFTEPYSSEIAYADEQLGGVLELLKRQGEYDRTLIVFTSDHGEGLLDHSESTHSLLIFDSTMHVPLIVKSPDEKSPGRRVDRLTSVVDIMPSILDLVDVESPSDVQGISFAPIVRGQEVREPERAVYMETLIPALHCGWGALRGLRTSSEKLIHGPKPRFYRVGEDSEEIYDLASAEPDAVERMTNRLEREMEAWTSAEAAGSLSAPDEEILRKLAALGYIAGGSGVQSESFDSLEEVQGREDPHERGWLFEMIGVATENLRMGMEFKGLQQLEELAGIDSSNPMVLTNLGKAHYIVTKNAEAAKQAFEQSLAVDPHQEEANHYLARILRAQGDLEGARRCAEKTLEFQPYSLSALHDLAAIHEHEGDFEGAREHLLHILEVDPTNISGLVNLALSYSIHDRYEDAGPIFKRALDLAPKSAFVLYNVGIWHLQGENTEEAISSLTRAIIADPTHASSHYVLGKLFLNRGEADRAREVLEVAREHARRAARIEEIDRMLVHIDAGGGATPADSN